MNELDIKLKNAKHVLNLLGAAKTSNTHDRTIHISMLVTCIRNVEEGIKMKFNDYQKQAMSSRLEQLYRATKRGEEFLYKIAKRGEI